MRWPRRPYLAGLQPASTALHAFLLDADDDLAQELDAHTRIAARQLATARVLDAGVGECELTAWFDAVRHGPGLLILDGLVAFETQVGDRTATELVGAGDLLQPPGERTDDLLQRRDGWRVLCPTRFALLDADFAERIRRCPQIVQALLCRAGRRIADIDVLRAITSQPRLEVRLVLLFWHLAARWGKVEPAGLRVSLPLTHRLLGQLVGAERPSVSHALGRLADAGLVTGPAVDLHLHGSLAQHLEALIERTNGTGEQPRTAHRPAGRQLA